MEASLSADTGSARRTRSRRLLFHSYHFPPIGGSGGQRPLRMARFLHEHGYQPTVVTGGGATTDRWAPEDETLLAEVPNDLRVLRLPASEEPEGSGRWRGRAERWLRLRSRWARWWIEGSAELGSRAPGDVDLIYVWMQPYDSAFAGVELSRSLRKPWVADLGDPWALDEMMVYPTALHRRRDLARMGRLLGTASAIVMSTPEAVRRLLEAFPEFADRPVVAIPNGFAAEDFAGPAPRRTDGKFRIVHTGYLHTELGLQLERSLPWRRFLQGSAPGLDILTRTHIHLVDAVNRLLIDEPGLRDLVELHLAGVLTEADRAVADRCPVVRLHGYVTHGESVELMRSAELLFLPMHNLPPGVRATIVPGKTYEYLASGATILGAVPDGDTRDLLIEGGNALVVRPDDVDGLVEALRKHIGAFQSGKPTRVTRADVVARFEYRRLAERLAGVFDDVLERT